MLIFVLICLIFHHITQAQDEKYCNPSLCRSWNGVVEPHIGCPGNAPDYCPPDAQEIVMTDDWIEYIVHKHNDFRNTLAGGNLENFPAAWRMPLMTWDPELADLARLNMMRCIYGHDKCRNTPNYRWSGQNIAWSKNYPRDNYHIETMLNAWWDEYEICPMSEILSFGKRSDLKIGHFTVMAQDRNDRLGCAAVRFNRNERMLACNYGFTNIIDAQVYEFGEPTSRCQTGRDSVYENLCSAAEIVDSNP